MHDTAPTHTALQTDLAALASRLHGHPIWLAPDWTPTRVSLHTQRITAVDDVRSALQTWTQEPSCLGWLETPQALVVLDADGPQALPDGAPLHAEFCVGERSLHVHWADGAWLLTTMVDHGKSAAAEGQPAWRSETNRLEASPGQRAWVYHTYHVDAGAGVPQPLAARLAGLRAL